MRWCDVGRMPGPCVKAVSAGSRAVSAEIRIDIARLGRQDPRPRAEREPGERHRERSEHEPAAGELLRSGKVTEAKPRLGFLIDETDGGRHPREVADE